MKALLLAPTRYGEDGGDGVCRMQLWPFNEYRHHLRSRLGLELHHVHANTAADILSCCSSPPPADVVFVRIRWQEEPSDVVKAMRHLRHACPSARIIFIDPFDQTSSRFFGALPFVDWFVKYQALRDVSLYQNEFRGGSLQTHVLATEHGYDLDGWHVGSDVPAGLEAKITPGWFVVPRDLVWKITRFGLPWSWAIRKTIDVCCHVSCGTRENMEWYGHMRKSAVDALQGLGGDFVVSLGADFAGEPRISRKDYVRHMKASRIAFSPLGWGEVTGRSYESILYGSLFMTPRIDHVAIEPDLAQPYVTYVPVRWDYADVEEKCRHYLSHPEEANRIVENARNVFVDYYRSRRFVSRIGELLYGSATRLDQQPGLTVSTGG